jgi:ABC-type glutathione transport system ATPase component
VSESVLEVRELSVGFARRSRPWRRARGSAAVLESVSLSVAPGETLAVVGASGAGKSTLARALLRLVEPGAGEILLRVRDDAPPVDLCRLSGRALREARRTIGIVFQDPYASLDPRWTVGRTLGEPLAAHTRLAADARGARAAEMLESVRLAPEYARRFPHELSGGERQRVALARALAARPRLLVCDEILSALDARAQAHVLELLRELRERSRVALVFVSHDLRVVRGFAHRVAVLHCGRVVEAGDPERLFAEPRHPHTRELVEAAAL